MTNVKKKDEMNRGRRSRLEDSYRQNARIMRRLTARQATAMDLDLCAKWMNVFRRATKEERRAKDYLVELILRQLRETGHLSLPFTNLANCSLDLRLLLDEEGRQRLRRISPRQVLAPMPSSSSMTRRRDKSSSFEWRRRMRHLDQLEDQYWREEQEVWSLQQPSAKCLKPKPLAAVSRQRNRVKTIGVQADVPLLTPRAERDLCERERKQCEILKRRERDLAQRQLREQERERQRTLLAKQQMLEKQRLEKARQLRDRRLREQQIKVKERRDHERHLLLKKRNERRLQEQRSWAQRRPSSPSSQFVEIQQGASLEPKPEARHDHDTRHLSQTTKSVPVDSNTTQSAKRMQQLHLREENIRRKVLAYEQLKKYHRERAQVERLRLEGNAEQNKESRNLQMHVTERKNLKQKNVEKEMETEQRKEFQEKIKNIPNRFNQRQEREDFERRNAPIIAKSDHKEELCRKRQLETSDAKGNDQIDRQDQKNREEIERKREQEAKIIQERQEREEFERKVLQKLETERRERKEFERNRQEELRILKERQEKEEFERRELEKKLKADLKQQEELERQREDKLEKLPDKEFERKFFDKLEADRKIREEFERQRREELKNLSERQEKEEFERKELEKKLEAEQKQKEDIQKLREEDLKCLKSLQSREEFERQVLEKLEAERKEREAFERKTCEEREREEKTIDDLKKKFQDLQERDAEWNEQQLKRALDTKEQEDCERIAREEERLEERLLEKLKRSKVEREARERKKCEDDLQRGKLLRKWLQKQEQKEDREREEREKRERKIKESLTKDGNRRREREGAEGNSREELDRLPKERQEKKKVEKESQKSFVWKQDEEEVDRRYPVSPKQEEIERDIRIQKISQSGETELMIKYEARKVAKRLQGHLISRLGDHRAGVGHLGGEKNLKQVASERKSESEKSVENAPGDMLKPGLTGKDVTNVNRNSQQLEGDRYENAKVRLKMLEERNSRIIQQVQEKFQVLEKLRLEAGELDAQYPFNKRYKLQSSKTRSSKTRSARWAQEESGAEHFPSQGRNGVIRSSSDSDAIPEPCFTLVGTYCPLKKTYTVERQSAPPIPYQDSAQREAFGSYVRNQVVDWPPPSSYSTDAAAPSEERAPSEDKSSGIGLTYCIRTGRKRFPQIKQSEINQDSCGLKEDPLQQRRVFGQLLSQARTFDCSPEILSAENFLLEKKLAGAKNKYLQESVLRISRYVISLFQNDGFIESFEEENASLENEELEQIYLQKIDSTLLFPKPIFGTLMSTLLTSNESISPHVSEKMLSFEVELKSHLKKMFIRDFARRGVGALRRKAKHLMNQQRQLQSRRLAEICRNSEEQTSELWRRLSRSSDSLRGIRNLFRDCCDLRDPISGVALQSIERLYKEWKDQRFGVNYKQC
ncbi:trichohyalin [Drosophila santomea]|uniref:trichohyalin n=1 Tax=Drosophila santomea TaxID=129105 RepID=UPI001953520F|nr:trichohyalin [Drosophila santomea]